MCVSSLLGKNHDNLKGPKQRITRKPYERNEPGRTAATTLASPCILQLENSNATNL